MCHARQDLYFFVGLLVIVSNDGLGLVSLNRNGEYYSLCGMVYGIRFRKNNIFIKTACFDLI